MTHGSNQFKAKGEEGQNCPSITLATAADMMGVSRRTVVSAAKIKKADPAAHAAIKAGLQFSTRVEI